MGGTHFEKVDVQGTVDEMMRVCQRFLSRDDPEQWCAQIHSRIFWQRSIRHSCDHLDHEMVRKANMILASSLG